MVRILGRCVSVLRRAAKIFTLDSRMVEMERRMVEMERRMVEIERRMVEMERRVVEVRTLLMDQEVRKAAVLALLANDQRDLIEQVRVLNDLVGRRLASSMNVRVDSAVGVTER